MVEGSAERAFRVRVDRDIAGPNILSGETLEVKKGPQAWKAAKLRVFGDKETGEVKKLEFAVEQYAARLHGYGYEFEEKPERRWYCVDAEVDALRAFLNDSMPESGTYVRVDDKNLPEALLQTAASGDLSVENLVATLRTLAAAPELAEEIASSDGAALLSEILEIRRQRIAIRHLRQIVEDPTSTEHDIQKVLEGNWWIFGGRFIRAEERRRLTVLDTIDIPLIRSDGSLHIVELKRANVRKLVEEHRSHLIVSSEVHEATMQAVNYLRSLDHKRDSILADFSLDCSRATAVVVIGHPAYSPQYSERDISEALRTYNAALNRVEVMTYKELLDGAERALELAKTTATDCADQGDQEIVEEPSDNAWDPFSGEIPF